MERPAAVTPETFPRPFGGEVVLPEHQTQTGRNNQLELRRASSGVCGRRGGARGADLGLTFDGDADRCMLPAQKTTSSTAMRFC